jgi:CheY-like chemotaxis protein
MPERAVGGADDPEPRGTGAVARGLERGGDRRLEARLVLGMQRGEERLDRGRFAEQSGGALAIASAPGQGTTVALWLPQAGGAAQPAADAAAGAEVVRPAFRATVLLVEDEADLREIMAAELEERGFSAVAAADGVAALGMLESGLRPMAIVTDLALPRGLDGLELLREARRMLPRLPAVLVTGQAGDAQPEALAAAEQGGPFAQVRKPSAAEVLVERLQRVPGEAPGQAVARG